MHPRDFMPYQRSFPWSAQNPPYADDRAIMRFLSDSARYLGLDGEKVKEMPYYKIFTPVFCYANNGKEKP